MHQSNCNIWLVSCIYFQKLHLTIISNYTATISFSSQIATTFFLTSPSTAPNLHFFLVFDCCLPSFCTANLGGQELHHEPKCTNALLLLFKCLVGRGLNPSSYQFLKQWLDHVAWDFLPLFQQCFSLSSETWKCQSPTTMSHIATFLSLFCDTCLTIWHFFLLAKTRSQKSKTLLQICLIVDKDKKLLSEINSCVQFVWNAFQVL